MGAYSKTQQYGGPGGDAFSDDLTQSCRLSSVTIRSGGYVDSIQGTYTMPSGATYSPGPHGGGGGDQQSFNLAPGEFIVHIDGRSGTYIDQLKFSTNLGNVHGPYGGDGGDPFTLSNLHVGGFFGQSGRYLDAVGFFTAVDC